MPVNLSDLEKLQEHLLLDCQAFAPELLICFTIVLMLFLRLFRGFRRTHLGGLALVLTIGAVALSWAQWQGIAVVDPRGINKQWPMFTGMLAFDNFTVFLRLFLYTCAALLIWLSMLTGIPDREDSADFYCLLLGATLGMSLMASANHLLMVYIGVEMASLPSYALAGFLKGRRQSSEAALKYVVYGGGAAGIMLYGISLLCGKFGTAYLPDVARLYVVALQQVGTTFDPVLLLGTLFVLIGIAFKLAAVPFHFWCPDVFEGAAAEVAAFLSVASKGAALALLGRVVMMLGGLDYSITPRTTFAEWNRVVHYLTPALAFFAVVTATFGNLAAYMQTNLKRLLAYSTIAHAGYMMMGLAPLSSEGASAVLFYLIAYLIMNLGAFAVVAFLRNQTGSEDLSSFRGMIRRSPVMVVTLAIFLLSLLGVPPLAGFAAKLQIFSVLFDAGNHYYQSGDPGLSSILYAVLIIGGINTVISAVYYLKVLKVMILETPVDETEGATVTPLAPGRGTELYAVLLSLAIFVVGILWDPLLQASKKGVDRFRQMPGRHVVVAQDE